MNKLAASILAILVLLGGCAAQSGDPANPSQKARIPPSGGYDAF